MISARLSPDARTSIHTSSPWGWRSSRSSTLRTSGPPGWVITIAFIKIMVTFEFPLCLLDTKDLLYDNQKEFPTTIQPGPACRACVAQTGRGRFLQPFPRDAAGGSSIVYSWRSDGQRPCQCIEGSGEIG